MFRIWQHAVDVMNRATILLLFFAGIKLVDGATCSPAPVTNDLNNPHKGFMLWGTDYADGEPDNFYGATIYHVYLPWREVEGSDQTFDWGRFETNHLLPILNDHSNATFVLRPVADYPDGENSGITLFYTGGELLRDFPRFLIESPLSIPYYAYASCDGDGPGWTPDWNHPAMITQLVQFVQAFAARYDGDPRITAVQTGLLGLWGEWHQSGCESHEPSNAVKIAVRDAYALYFTHTPVQTRYPRTPDATGVDCGFHEDYFPSFTAPCIYGFPSCDDSGDWSLYYCYQHITPAATNNWRVNPISGESPMTNQKQTWSNDFNDVMTVLQEYHFSFLGPAGGHEWNGNQARLQPMKRLLGYNYHLRRVDWPDTVELGHSFSVTLVLTNTGAAPCYHRFPVELALCDTQGAPQWRTLFEFDLRALTPDLHFAPTESFLVTNLATGVYAICVGILDPRTGEPGVRLQSAGENAHYRIAVGEIEVRDPWLDDRDEDGLPDEWEFLYFGGFTNAVPTDDPDHDRYSNWEHYVSGTDPTNPESYFAIDGSGAVTGLILRIMTLTNRAYCVQRSSQLIGPQWDTIGTVFTGTGVSVEIRDADPASTSFYRAVVGFP